jgi:hypothetical protein
MIAFGTLLLGVANFRPNLPKQTSQSILASGGISAGARIHK